MGEVVNLIPRPGEHVITIGQNGSGKTFFNIWLLLRIPQAPIVIYDTKDEPKFRKLPASQLVETMEEALKLKEDRKIDYIIVRPPVQMMRHPDILDDMLWVHYNEFRSCPAYIDEGFTFMMNGRAGPGMTALLTRGRSRGISTIISAQRPVRLDRFIITEAKKAFVFRLVDRADRKRLDDIIPNYSDMVQPPKHGFYYFETGLETPILFKPIELDSMFDTGYSDDGGDHASGDAGLINPDNDKSPNKHVWF